MTRYALNSAVLTAFGTYEHEPPSRTAARGEARPGRHGRDRSSSDDPLRLEQRGADRVRDLRVRAAEPHGRARVVGGRAGRGDHRLRGDLHRDGARPGAPGGERRIAYDALGPGAAHRATFRAWTPTPSPSSERYWQSASHSPPSSCVRPRGRMRTGAQSKPDSMPRWTPSAPRCSGSRNANRTWKAGSTNAVAPPTEAGEPLAVRHSRVAASRASGWAVP